MRVMPQPSTINMAKTSSPSTLACARLRLGNKRRTSLCMAALLGCEDDGIAFLLVECQIWESIPHQAPQALWHVYSPSLPPSSPFSGPSTSKPTREKAIAPTALKYHHKTTPQTTLSCLSVKTIM